MGIIAKTGMAVQVSMNHPFPLLRGKRGVITDIIPYVSDVVRVSFFYGYTPEH
jgi:hypothetical protein